jgi:hypothetical protein
VGIIFYSDKKGQIAIEFLMMLIIVVLIATFISGLAYYYVTDYSEQRNIKRLQSLGRSLQDEIILAHNVEYGYVRTLSIPQSLGSVDVLINNTRNDIYLTYKRSELSFRIPPTEGTFAIGTNLIKKLENGSVRIN